MIPIRILDEIAPLESVVLGTARSFGGIPAIEDTFDPKTKENIINGTFPKEADLIPEMEIFCSVLERYNVEVLRPEIISHYNQIFARDIGIAIGERFIVPSVTHNRKMESNGIQHITDQVDPKCLLLPDLHIRMEGGDVMPWNGQIFVGYSKKEDFDTYIVARTNEAGVEYLEQTFSDWEVIALELSKSDDNPPENALHLDCCFQPLGKGKAIIHRKGFKNSKDVDNLISQFGEKNIHFIDKQEMYEMNSNLFSITPDVVVSDSGFVRLNDQLKTWDFIVEEVKYQEVAKMEGLFRCTTIPLRRKYE